MRNWSSKFLRIKVIIELKELFQKQIRGERYLISKTLIVCEMMKYNLVKEHMLILYKHMRRLKHLQSPKSLGTNIILAFILMSYSSFIMKVVMIGWIKKVSAKLFCYTKRLLKNEIWKNTNYMMMVIHLKMQNLKLLVFD
jgi:hypothetical protein